MFKRSILVWDEDSSALLVIECDLIDKIEPLKAVRYWLLNGKAFDNGDEYTTGSLEDYSMKYLSTIRVYDETDSEGDVTVFELDERLVATLDTVLEEKYSYNWDGPLDEDDEDD
jgi:hypothetical protein